MPIPPDDPVWIPAARQHPSRPAVIWLPDPATPPPPPATNQGFWGMLIASNS